MRSLDLPIDHVVEAARDIFGPENVRFYGGGIPNVFLDGGDLVPLMNRVNCLLIGFPYVWRVAQIGSNQQPLPARR